jgi:MraZ protein
MQGDGIFTGFALARLDSADRLALPAQLRNSVPVLNPDRPTHKQVYICQHMTAPCLIGASPTFRATIDAYVEKQEDIAIRRNQPFNFGDMSGRLHGGEVMPIDGSGRFSVPDQYRFLGGLEGELFLRGMGQFFEIWQLDRIKSLRDDPAFAGVQLQVEAAERAEAEKKKKGGKA